MTDPTTFPAIAATMTARGYHMSAAAAQDTHRRALRKIREALAGSESHLMDGSPTGAYRRNRKRNKRIAVR